MCRQRFWFPSAALQVTTCNTIYTVQYKQRPLAWAVCSLYIFTQEVTVARAKQYGSESCTAHCLSIPLDNQSSSQKSGWGQTGSCGHLEPGQVHREGRTSLRSGSEGSFLSKASCRTHTDNIPSTATHGYGQ